jgi:hypothetical protein
MKPVNAEENPGLAKLPTEVRNKMGYMKKGGLMKKAKRFNGEDGSVIEDESEIIFDNRSVKSGKLPSETMSRETIVEEPVKRKSIVKSRPAPSFTVDRTPNSERMAKAMVNEIKNPSKAETRSVAKSYEPFEGNYIPSKAKPKTLQEKRDMRESRRDSIVSKMASGGKVKSASARADGCAIRGKTRA